MNDPRFSNLAVVLESGQRILRSGRIVAETITSHYKEFAPSQARANDPGNPSFLKERREYERICLRATDQLLPGSSCLWRHRLGRPRGENIYRLHVPVSQFWAVIVYNLETSSFFPNSTRLTVDSLDKGLSKNADGSVDIYFGPKVPASQESNWIYTQTEKSWFPWFRFYGPEKALFDKSWTMPDIEMLKQ